MEWLIDGYNLLISNGLGHSETARDRLARRLWAFFPGVGDRVIIVYDSRGKLGVEKRRISSSISEVYTASADRYLVRRVEQSHHPRSIILVTDDREIVFDLRAYKITRKSTAEFLKMLASPSPRSFRPEKPEYETPENIERYLRLFGEEEEGSELK